ncbi:uncharacterized protein [Haliotis cracherodii]|uniref:uncharacterized protein n=1 Tax=Haliotis cracherodii TaxID=6455 RepID=UPI0039EAF641
MRPRIASMEELFPPRKPNYKYPTSLMKRLLSAYNLEAVKSVAWGIHHESVAVRAYEAGGGLIENTGIWMHESGVLGASPDGLVKAAFMMPVMFQSPAARHFLPDIIEVKCPYAARIVGIQAAVDTVKGFCLVRGENGCLHLSDSHEYYHQIQGQMYILGKQLTWLWSGFLKTNLGHQILSN